MRRRVPVDRGVSEIPFAAHTLDVEPRLAEPVGHSHEIAERDKNPQVERETFANSTARRKTRSHSCHCSPPFQKQFFGR